MGTVETLTTSTRPFRNDAQTSRTRPGPSLRNTPQSSSGLMLTDQLMRSQLTSWPDCSNQLMRSQLTSWPDCSKQSTQEEKSNRQKLIVEVNIGQPNKVFGQILYCRV